MTAGYALVVDRDPRARDLVAALLTRIGLETRAAKTGADALAQARADRPELVLLDIHLADTSGYELLLELRDSFGEHLPVIFLSATRTEPYDRVAGLLLGADDYLAKPFDGDELLARARAVVRRSGTGLAARRPEAALTAREREILQLLASGLKQQDIADRLVISPKTVATHIQHVLTKLGVHSRAQAVGEAYRQGLVAAVGDEPVSAAAVTAERD